MHLYFKECEIQLPCFFKGFNKLIRLILKSITLSSDMFESLISNCPLLEDLVLKDIHNPYFMSINAPKLRSFVFRGDLQLIHLENVPVLSNVLYAPRELVLDDEDDFVNIFWSVPSLQCFSLFFELSFALCIIRSSTNLECILSDGDYFECVPQEVVDEIPASFSDITFNHMRTVMFYDVLLEEVEMHLIMVLLAKSPALVKMNYFEHARREAVDDIPERFSDMTFNHLRTVKINDVTGVAAEMHLIKVLLAMSPTLEVPQLYNNQDSGLKCSIVKLKVNLYLN
ncbi:F-box/FBD/LRR-repeat protein At1g13570-like [Solanum lycopersicum]|uniref:F-box/FBD/LRR-repeat protein At1g13570-like n=1 Tax=Solanum lycopersicum TaxID=4081 RepID=UPI0037493B78